MHDDFFYKLIFVGFLSDQIREYQRNQISRE